MAAARRFISTSCQVGGLLCDLPRPAIRGPQSHALMSAAHEWRNERYILSFDLTQRRNELIDGDAGLPQHAAQRADFQLLMVGNHAAGRAATKHDVTSALPPDDKSQPFKGADRFAPRNARKARHSSCNFEGRDQR